MELREPLSQRIFFGKKRLFFYCNRQPKQLIWVGLHTLPDRWFDGSSGARLVSHLNLL